MRLSPLGSTCWGLVLLLPLEAAHGQQPTPNAPLVLDEIVVTARKREELLQDVPVSVVAVSGERIRAANVSKAQDLQALIPNLNIVENAINNILLIRGAGSGANQGFEQSVGTYVDGVYRGRSQQVRIPYLDLDRVEVLRGPQSILFGKDTIAGAMNITTAAPTATTTGQLTALYEPELNERYLAGYISGPLSERVGARLAAHTRSTDGFIENLITGNDEPQKDERQVRLTLDWDVNDDLDFRFKAESTSFDLKGKDIEVVQDNPAVAGPFAGLTYARILQMFGQPAAVANNTFDYKRTSNGEFSRNDASDFVLTSHYYGWENTTVTQILARSSYDFEELCDCDFTGANLFSARFAEDFSQLSYELRFSSTNTAPLTYVAGYSYLDNELDFFDSLLIPANSMMVPLISARLGAGRGELLGNTATARHVNLGTRMHALFGQWTWQTAPNLRINIGARISREDEDGRRDLAINTYTYQPLPAATAPFVQALYAGVFNLRPHTLSGDRQSTSFLPSVSLQYDASDSAMLFVSVSKGEKSGGFDARSNNPPSAGGAFEFDDESALNIEVGAKLALLAGRAELNAVVFHTTYDDMQVSTHDGNIGYNVGNAARSTSQGLELDGRVRLTENLSASASLAYTDFEFRKFFGQCSVGTPPNAPDGINCDYRGRTNYYLPELSAAVSLDYSRALGNGLQISTVIDTQIVDDYYLTSTLDRRQVQDAFVRVSASVALGPVSDKWSIALVGKNLTDRMVRRAANDLPLSGSSFGAPGFFALVDPPRTIALQAMIRL